MKRGVVDKQGESMVASYRYLGVSNQSNECEALRQLESLLRINEAWMDECAARLQPLGDQYKPRQHQTFATEKTSRFDRNNPIMSWGQNKSLLKKICFKKNRS